MKEFKLLFLIPGALRTGGLFKEPERGALPVRMEESAWAEKQSWNSLL